VWEHIYKMPQLAQLLGQLGVFLTRGAGRRPRTGVGGDEAEVPVVHADAERRDCPPGPETAEKGG
jgi:hypothetical protein